MALICVKCEQERDESEFYWRTPEKKTRVRECCYCMRKRSKRPPDHWRERDLRRAYGIGVDDYERMLMDQGGVCALCGGTTPSRRLAVDHDHKTGRIRGLLCTPCNTGISMMDRHGADWVTRAVGYLEG